MAQPRPEYPRPQCVRDEWLCLNGEWQFARDPGDSGWERGLVEQDLPDRITVPFCIESPLSGIGDPDYHNAVWYRRTVAIPPAWRGRRVLLHCQAVDYDATVWVGGVEVVRHRGGFTPFQADITDQLDDDGLAVIVIRARDDGRALKPQGKQARRFGNTGCHYTRTTGIWQTVWLEPVSATHLRRPRLTPRFSAGQIEVLAPLSRPARDHQVRAELRDAAGVVAEATGDCADGIAPRLTLSIPPERRRPWSPADPFLYDLVLRLVDGSGAVIDQVQSYAGLRSVTIDGHRVLLNGEPVFQRLVLDQGYYPDGIMTAPSDEALVRDIELSLAAGFNGARLHQKVFEERFLYHADRLGYLVWGEFGDWSTEQHGFNRPRDWAPAAFAAQWAEALERDLSHPAIIGWCPVNESVLIADDRIDAFEDVIVALYRTTKLADPDRPVFDTSGWTHRIPDADCYDIHCYSQDAEELDRTTRERLAGAPMTYAGRPFQNLSYDLDAGRPFMVSEFGGVWWNAERAASQAANSDDSWGYGDRCQDVDEVYRRFETLCSVLLDNPAVFGYCYTQLTDVFQEQNGIYHFDRTPKFDNDRLRAVQQRRAAIEQA